MAGIPSGRINCISVIPGGPNNEQRNSRSRQERFTSLWKFLETQATAGRVTLIASNYGVSAGITAVTRNGGAVNYWDDPSQNWLGHGAWSVWYFQNAAKPWYLFIQLSLCTGAANYLGGNMLVMNGADPVDFWMLGLGIQAAWATDAGGNIVNPWNGTTNANGLDQPWPAGNPAGARWTAPVGGKVYVLPRENNTSGNFATTKKSAAAIGFTEGFNTYYDYAYGVMCDDDSIAFIADACNFNSWSVSLISPYTPRTGYTIPIPYVMFTQSYNELVSAPGGVVAINRAYFAGTNNWGSPGQYVFGNIAPNGPNFNNGLQGGILIPSTNPDDNPRQAYVDRLSSQSQTVLNPGNATGQNRYDEWQLVVGAWENSATPTSAFGVLGELDSFYREVNNVGSSDTNSTLTRIFLGASTLGVIKASLPWDGVTVPRNYGIWPASRDGVTF